MAKVDIDDLYRQLRQKEMLESAPLEPEKKRFSLDQKELKKRMKAPTKRVSRFAKFLSKDPRVKPRYTFQRDRTKDIQRQRLRANYPVGSPGSLIYPYSQDKALVMLFLVMIGAINL